MGFDDFFERERERKTEKGKRRGKTTGKRCLTTNKGKGKRDEQWKRKWERKVTKD